MRHLSVIALTAIAAAIAATSPMAAQTSGAQGAEATERAAQGDPGGMLRTLEQGVYSCALPGDAAGAAWEPVPEADFRIGPSSSYESSAGQGTYILRGRQLTFTRGPKKGERFEQVGRNTLRGIEQDERTGKLTCTRIGPSR